MQFITEQQLVVQRRGKLEQSLQKPFYYVLRYLLKGKKINPEKLSLNGFLLYKCYLRTCIKNDRN